MEFVTETVESPIGSIELVSDGENLVSLDFSDCHERMTQSLFKRFGAYQLQIGCTGFKPQLIDYFQGDLKALSSVSFKLNGTPFQNTVWKALGKIPIGTTLTYGELAIQIGKPRAAQAVGRANSMNPILIAIPCHRVVGKQEKLVGYSAGIHRKAWLLKHEKQ